MSNELSWGQLHLFSRKIEGF